MCGALCALGSYKLVQIFRTRFLKMADDVLADTLRQSRGEMRQNLQMEASAAHLRDGKVETIPISKLQEKAAKHEHRQND